MNDAEADIKRLELEVEEIKREVEKQPNVERIYRWLKGIKSKESIEDYKQLIQASVAVLYNYADGGTLIFYTWQNTKELELSEVRTILENLKASQMAVESHKTKKDGTTNECCDTVLTGSPPERLKERLFVIGERACYLTKR